MLRDRLRQENAARGRHRSELSPPVMRSPALEAAERQERHDLQVSENGARGPVQKKTSRNVRVSYAAEDTLVRPAPRKSLPPVAKHARIAATPAIRQRTGLTASWRLRPAEVAAPPSTPIQVISDEEQKKLSELEMRLPRMATPRSVAPA